MEVARAAGLRTPELMRGEDGSVLSGTCDRGDGTPADFAVYAFIEGAVQERKAMKAISKLGPPWQRELELMAKLHSHDPGAAEATKPLPRFESWRDQLDYLESLAAGTNSQIVGLAAAVRQMFESASVPDLHPSLCHLDWHLGNVLMSPGGEVLAVLDWEFAGIADPRFDLVRYVRRHRFTGDGERCRHRRGGPGEQELWEHYSQLRYKGPGAIHLGPMEPWLALECLAVVVLTAAICTRVAAGAQGGDPVGSERYVPRCDLLEWVEDMQTSVFHLRRLGVTA
jgi:aminoglycoside phosphotransferase (APT) family kinase protein